MVAPLGTRSTRAQELAEKANKTFEGVAAGVHAREALKELPEARQSLQTRGLREATLDAWETSGRNAQNPTGKLNLGGKAAIGFGGLEFVNGVAHLPGQVGTATADVRQAARTRSREDVSRAVQSVATAGSTASNVVGTGLTAAQTANKLVTSYRYATDAFEAAAPAASAAVTRAAGRAAATAGFEGATRSAAVSATRSAVKTAALRASEGTMARAAGVASRGAAKAVLETGGRAAAEAALEGGAHAAASTLGRAAGRFVPGVNIAIAAFDSANAAATWADPKASMGKKIGNSVTALGSIAAATDIPIVSQVGAGVSVVSSFVSSFF